MLIRFRLKNFLSYKGNNTLSMIKSSERSHSNHILEGKYVQLLKGAVLYGANASGKSNLVKAISVAQNLILEQRKKDILLPDYRNKLYSKCSETPTEFEFEFEHNNEIYAYGFSWTPEKIHEEWLYKLGKTTENKLFERKNGKIKIEASNQELISIARKTPERQLFINFFNQMNFSENEDSTFLDYKNCFDWFKTSLIVLYPTHQFAGWARMDNNELTKEFMKKSLCSFGIEVDDIEFSDLNINQLPFPKPIIEDIYNQIPENESVPLQGDDYDFYLLTKKNGKLIARELKFIHKSDTEKLKSFSFSEESDGTRRLTDFLPLFFILNDKKPNTIFIDEIDRSLHSELTYNLLNQFLSSKGKDQIITTTHETSLLNTEILRRDEIWFSEKTKDNGSNIYSLSEFKPRKDKDIQKDYLLGRYGAIPFFESNIDTVIGETIGKK